jgi:hypothetical protein
MTLRDINSNGAGDSSVSEVWMEWRPLCNSGKREALGPAG